MAKIHVSDIGKLEFVNDAGQTMRLRPSFITPTEFELIAVTPDREPEPGEDIPVDPHLSPFDAREFRAKVLAERKAGVKTVAETHPENAKTDVNTNAEAALKNEELAATAKTEHEALDKANAEAVAAAEKAEKARKAKLVQPHKEK